MTAYADYDFYAENYPEELMHINCELFGHFAVRASRIIDRYTSGRIDPENTSSAVKYCCCEIAELLYTQAQSAHDGIASEKTGDLSVTYESGEIARKNLKSKIRAVIYEWLADTGLLYRGVS